MNKEKLNSFVARCVFVLVVTFLCSLLGAIFYMILELLDAFVRAIPEDIPQGLSVLMVLGALFGLAFSIKSIAKD